MLIMKITQNSLASDKSKKASKVPKDGKSGPSMKDMTKSAAKSMPCKKK
jgi:hypothetical protein